ncbi:MAG TPA: hypothetical protein VFE65_05430 [Pseudonocardia sp.]|jgi:hypothetical protein|nr:hypothetical protein [Pseudonocardia sp.]
MRDFLEKQITFHGTTVTIGGARRSQPPVSGGGDQAMHLVLISRVSTVVGMPRHPRA